MAQINFKVNDGVKQAIKNESERLQLTMASVCKLALMEYLERNLQWPLNKQPKNVPSNAKTI